MNKRQFRTQDGDSWEAASRFLYSVYDIDEQTVVILNGDRAPWIRQGVEYFPRALYQVDVFHLAREVRQLFGPQAESQMDTFSDRVKGRGRSWSERGLASLMEVLCWRNTEALGQVLEAVERLLVQIAASLEEVKHTAAHWVHRVVEEGLGSLQARVPIRGAGRTASRGLSWLMNRWVCGPTG